MTAPPGTIFNHAIEITCIQTITILYKYFYIWELNFRLNNINYYQLLFLIIIDICIDIYHYCYHYWTSESLLNFWECTQDSNITNKWVVHFVIKRTLQVVRAWTSCLASSYNIHRDIVQVSGLYAQFIHHLWNSGLK